VTHATGGTTQSKTPITMTRLTRETTVEDSCGESSDDEVTVRNRYKPFIHRYCSHTFTRCVTASSLQVDANSIEALTQHTTCKAVTRTSLCVQTLTLHDTQRYCG
jgi:hypothetical protein